MLRAIMDISARAVSLPDRPRVGHSGHQCSHAPGRPILHLISILSQTSAGNRLWDYVIADSLSVQFLCLCHGAVPSSRPVFVLARCAQGPSRMAVALGSLSRCSACKSSRSAVFVATNLIVGRCTASAIASASRKSFFCPFEYGRTYFAGISRAS